MVDSRILQAVWPLNPPHKERTKTMKVLALGLPRTGTESLRTALHHLGYDHVYHGLDTISNVEDCVSWCELVDRKRSGQLLRREDFDAVLGHCEAVTDSPAANFAKELIAAYPEAKIIVNRRKSIDEWTDTTNRALDGTSR